MENARDTFYVELRSRLAGLNPARQIVVRGVSRPGVLVENNEFATSQTTPDAFGLRWTGARVDAHGPMPMISMTCEIRYATDGSVDNGGMDRGRMLAAMDAELMSVVHAFPQSAAKMDYASSPAVATGTRIFWGDLAFGPIETKAERLSRTATIEVFSYQEAGEL